MSYTYDWIEPIFDRTQEDVNAVRLSPGMENPKGCYNYNDLNRIEKDTRYVAENMLERKIIRQIPTFTTIADWDETDIPTFDDMNRIVRNVMTLVAATREANPEMADKLYNITSGQMNFIVANQIEKNLYDMKNQPQPPVKKFFIKINHGIIDEINASEGWFEENEIITIRGVPYGDDAVYQVFTRWSGPTDDIQYIGDVTARVTSFQVQYRDSELTANFETRIPRTLTLSSAHICENGEVGPTGPTSGTFYAGDRILIVATVAAPGKAFYEWLGTQAGLDNLTGGTEPSSAWLIMPDCDVTLQPRYINAGQHYVTVKNGEGSGWYNYNDTVYISPNTPSHYAFTYWSGDTGYLENVTAGSFKMPDVNVTLTANFAYQYSYNDVTVINGTIDGQTKITSARQGSTHTLAPTNIPEGQGLQYWSIEGYGSVSTDDLGNHTNTFTVGDGNGIVTAHFNYNRNIAVTNVNNNNSTTNYTIVQGRKLRLTTNSTVGNYRFVRWEENGTSIGTSTTLDITIGDSDRNITAIYQYYPTYTVTLINRNNGGATTTSQVISGNYWSSTTNEEVGDYLLVGWNKNGSQVSTSTSYGFYVNSDTTIEVVYRPKETYHLTVNNGTGSGDYKERQSVAITANDGDFSDWTYSGLYYIGSTTSKSTTVKLGRGNGTVTANYNLRRITVIANSGTNTYNVRQGASINISANPAPDTYEFDQWSLTSGDGTIGNYLRESTTFTAGSQDATITATYKAIPWFNVTVQNGSGSGRYLRGSTPSITMDPAPEGMQFLQWEVLQGDQNIVYQPLAETTRLNALYADTIVRATYYIPKPDITYTITVNNKGIVEQDNYPAGYEFDVYAESPDEGWEFSKWSGDTQYIVDRYNPTAHIRMPARNIEITANYKREGSVETSMLRLENGLCLVDSHEDEETGEVIETWDWMGEFPENTIVPIKVLLVNDDSYFSGWTGTTESMSTVDELQNPKTTVHIQDFDVSLRGDTTLKDTYTLDYSPKPELPTPDKISGSYWEGEEVAIWFQQQDDQNRQYTFKRWSGTAAIAFDNFDILTPGTELNPQIVHMPAQTGLVLTPQFDIGYKLNVVGGTINSQKQFFVKGETVTITANAPQTGYVFICWEGDTSNLDDPYKLTPTVTIPNSAITLTAKFVETSSRNSIGYITTPVDTTGIVLVEDITIISGQIEVGCLITDSLGHIYMITNYDTTSTSVTQLTKTSKGGNVYE